MRESPGMDVLDRARRPLPRGGREGERERGREGGRGRGREGEGERRHSSKRLQLPGPLEPFNARPKDYP